MAAAGLMPEAMRRGNSSSTAPAWKTAFSMPFRLALSLARSIETATMSTPTAFAQVRAARSVIVPTPQ